MPRVLTQEEVDRRAEVSGPGRGAAGTTPADEGRRLFIKLQCANCHRSAEKSRGPNLEGLLGRKVQLTGGGVVVADEAYVRESVLRPKAKVVDGWKAVMPSYDEQVSEADLVALVAYLRWLKPEGKPTDSQGSPQPVGPPKP